MTFSERVVPFLSGNNDTVGERMMKELRNANKLRWSWYVAKDQIFPLRFEPHGIITSSFCELVSGQVLPEGKGIGGL
jgi:hypothetical protein